MGIMRHAHRLLHGGLLVAMAVCARAQTVPFTDVFSEIPLPAVYVGAVAGHFYGDTNLDLLVVTADHRLLCYPGQGDGTFGTPLQTTVTDAVPPVPVWLYGAGRSVVVGREVFKGDSWCGFTLNQTLPIRVTGTGNFGVPFITTWWEPFRGRTNSRRSTEPSARRSLRADQLWPDWIHIRWI